MTPTEFVTDQISLADYPVRYAGCRFNARMSVIRLGEDRLMLHSPGPIDGPTQARIAALGEVACIVAPGSFHHLHIPTAQLAFAGAKTHICPGIEQKRPDLAFDWILGPMPPALWADVIDQALIRGGRFMWEVATIHRPTRTLFVVDAIENVTDATPGVNRALEAWFKYVFRIWNRPAPVPEYRLGWKDRRAARRAFDAILSWGFDSIVRSHGKHITENARPVAQRAWRLHSTATGRP